MEYSRTTDFVHTIFSDVVELFSIGHEGCAQCRMPRVGDTFVISSATTSDSTLPSVAPRRPAEVLEHAALKQDVLVYFDRFHAPLLGYVCSCGLALGDGEDVVQDVFLLLFRHLQRDRSRANLEGWLFRVAHNLALKLRARQRREAAWVLHDLQPASVVIDPDPNPELRLVDCERRHRLRSVLNALPERERQCLHLRHKGLRYREIANVLEISLGAVAKTVARAIGRLERADQR
jgi:RNA polymerase sigma-70 factor (ECF subfamily)